MATQGEDATLDQIETTVDDDSLMETIKSETTVNFVGHIDTTVNYGGQPESTVNYGGQPESTVNFGGQPESIVNYGGQPDTTMIYGGQSDTAVNYGGRPDTTMNYGGQLDTTMNHAGQPKTTIKQLETTVDYGCQPATTVDYSGQPEISVNFGNQPETSVNYGDQPETIVNFGGQPETIVNVNSMETTPVSVNQMETTIDNVKVELINTSVGVVEVSLVKQEADVEHIATQVDDTDFDVQEETINVHQILEDEAVFDYDFEPLPNGEFVSGIEAYEIIKRHDHVFQDCPKGPKSNIFFLIDNSENLKRKSDNCKCYFNDDCGVWDNTASRLHHSYYHMTNKFKLIFKRADLYCSKVAKSGGTCYIPYEPQPEENEVLHMIRYSTTLKSDPKFHKHVTYFTCPADPQLGEVALYEYLGSNAGNMPSKNMKRKPISRAEVKQQDEIKRRKEGYSEQKMEFDKEREPSPAFGFIENGSFMTAFQAFDKIVCHKEVYEECPPGNKSNMWLLVDNSDNIKRVQQKQKRNFYDDCGVWNNRMSRTHIQYYLLHDNFRIVLKKDGIYCTKKTGKGKNLVHVPLSPQPKEEDVVEMYRYQTCLASNPDFKKHVTYFTSACDPELGAVAIYEYVGTYSGDSSTSKVRTRPKVLEKMRGEILSRKTGEIYSELAKDLTSTKQVRNMKYREKYLLKHGVRPGVKKDTTVNGTIQKLKIAATEQNSKGKQKTVFHIISN